MGAASTSEGIQLDETAAGLWGLNGPVMWPDAVLQKNARSQAGGKARKPDLWLWADKDCGAAVRNGSEFKCAASSSLSGGAEFGISARA
jgi:hypothetical protein